MFLGGHQKILEKDSFSKKKMEILQITVQITLAPLSDAKHCCSITHTLDKTFKNMFNPGQDYVITSKYE